MDAALWHCNEQKPAAELAGAIGIDVAHAEFIYKDIDSKRRTTASLHWPALLVESVKGPHNTPPQQSWSDA
jgi:NAD+ synthase